MLPSGVGRLIRDNPDLRFRVYRGFSLEHKVTSKVKHETLNVSVAPGKAKKFRIRALVADDAEPGDALANLRATRQGASGEGNTDGVQASVHIA